MKTTADKLHIYLHDCLYFLQKDRTLRNTFKTETD